MKRVVVLIAAVAVLTVLTGCNPEETPLSRSTAIWGDSVCQVGVVGDSLTVGADQLGGLRRKFEARGCQVTNVDAKVGRHTPEGARVVEAWRDHGVLPRILVVALGTNDCERGLVKAQVDRIMAAAGPDRPVVWVNSWRPGCDGAINGALVLTQITLEDRPDQGNLWIQNFQAWVRTNPGVLARDGVHLNTGGYQQHADNIVRSVMG